MKMYLEEDGVIYEAVRVASKNCYGDCDATSKDFCYNNASSLGSGAICNKLEDVLKGDGGVVFKEVK